LIRNLKFILNGVITNIRLGAGGRWR